MNALYERCLAQMPDAMVLWEQLVNIDSGSGDAAGLRAVAAILEEQLSQLGCAITRHPAKNADGEYSIVARLSGSGEKSVLLMAHMDTVFPPGTAAKRPFTVKGNWAYGPGVADCKCGIVGILHMVKLLDVADYKHLTILFNCDEEIGSPASKDIVIAETKKHEYVLSYEPGSIGDNLAVARKGSGKIKVETFGKNTHAGSAPEKGINAMAELVWQVNRMLDLGDEEKKTSVVFTKILCGDRTNVMPDYGEAWADVRCALPEELDRLDRDLERITSEQLLPNSRVQATLVRGRPPFPRNEATDNLAGLARKIYKELGLELSGEAVGGVGDINYAYGHGAGCLCRMAAHGANPGHSPDEDVYIPSMASRMYLGVRMIRELCGKGDCRGRYEGCPAS